MGAAIEAVEPITDGVASQAIPYVTNHYCDLIDY